MIYRRVPYEPLFIDPTKTHPEGPSEIFGYHEWKMKNRCESNRRNGGLGPFFRHPTKPARLHPQDNCERSDVGTRFGYAEGHFVVRSPMMATTKA
jgi:hypothetical protein